MSYTQESKSFFLLENCVTQYVSWLSLRERILWELKMILVSFRGKPVFFISSEKILSVWFSVPFWNSLYSGHILTKSEGSGLPPWLFTLEAVLRSAIVTFCITDHSQIIIKDFPVCQVLVTHQPTSQLQVSSPGWTI